MRVRQLIPHLSYKTLVEKKIIPDLEPAISKDLLVAVKRFPQWAYANKSLDKYGILAELMLRYGLKPPALKPEVLAIMQSQTMVEQIKSILRITEVDKSLQAGIGKMMQWLKKEPWLQHHYVGDVQLEHGAVQGHPDLINANVVLDVKCCSKLANHVGEFALQILSYVALGRKMGYPLEYCGLILPLQQQVLVFDVRAWSSQSFLDTLQSAAVTVPTKSADRLTDFKTAVSSSILDPRDIKIILIQERIPLYVHKKVGHHVRLDEFTERLSTEQPYQVMIRNGRSGKCALEGPSQTINWTDPKLAEFKTLCRTRQVFIHAAYIINLSNPRTKKSPDEEWVLNLVRNDLAIGKSCGFRGVVIHVGKHMNVDTKLIKMKTTVDKLLDTATPECPLLLETPAGEGTEVLTRLEEFGAFCNLYRDDPRFGVVIDSAHVWGTGYNPFEYFQQLQALVPGKIKLIHYNDSEVKCGSRKDAHMPKGHGHIGNVIMDQIALLASRLDIPMVIE